MAGLSQITLNVWSAIFVAAALHGWFLSFVLLFRKKNVFQNRFYSVLLFIFSFHLTTYLLFLTGVIKIIPHYFGSTAPLLYLIGPFFYFFVYALLEGRPKFSPKQLLHFLPAIFVFFRFLPFYLESSEQKLIAINRFFSAAPPEQSFFDVLVSQAYAFHIIAYLVYVFWILQKRESETNLPERLRKIRFLRRGAAGYAGFLLFRFAVFFFVFATGLPGVHAELLLVLILAISLHAIGYFAITEKGVFATTSPALNGEKYQTSPLTRHEMDALGAKLLNLMQQEKPFLNADLKISHIAQKLDVPPHHVSQILNQPPRTGFYDFINAYRIDEAKRRLTDEKYSHYKIQAIAEDAGFKNKASFNRIFKNYTGQTPSEFRSSRQQIKV